MAEIKVDTDAISAAANHLDELKTDLERSLKETSDIVNSLEGSWVSPAASAAIGSYQSFSTRCLTDYGKRMETFHQYLLGVAQQNWVSAEALNRDISADLP